MRLDCQININRAIVIDGNKSKQLVSQINRVGNEALSAVGMGCCPQTKNCLGNLRFYFCIRCIVFMCGALKRGSSRWERISLMQEVFQLLDY